MKKNQKISTLCITVSLFLFTNCILDRDRSELPSTNKIIVPTINLSSITDITTSSAVCGGEIVSAGGGKISSYGLCWFTEAQSKSVVDGMPTVNNKKTIHYAKFDKIFKSGITGLNRNTTYVVRAFAINSAGLNYSDAASFTTASADNEVSTVIDKDGNVYNVVTVGSQKWMAENLLTTHYRNGDTIFSTHENSTWTDLTYGGYRFNDDNPASGSIGALYNWYSVIDERQIAPAGWHIPTKEEFSILKSVYDFGKLLNLNEIEGLSSVYFKNGWWSASEGNPHPFCLYFSADEVVLGDEAHNKTTGMFIRCIKN